MQSRFSTILFRNECQAQKGLPRNFHLNASDRHISLFEKHFKPKTFQISSAKLDSAAKVNRIL